MSNRQTHAAALRQVTLGLRLGAVNHDEAVSILEALVDSFELHAATNRYREQRAREDYLRNLPGRKTIAQINAEVEAEAREYEAMLQRIEASAPQSVEA
jgi:hypothetical protein